MTDTLRRYVTLGKLVKDDGKSVYSDSWKAVYLAADVERVVEELEAYKKQCACRYCGKHHLNISVCSKCGFANKDAPHFIQQAHALAAKNAVIQRLQQEECVHDYSERDLYCNDCGKKHPDYD